MKAKIKLSKSMTLAQFENGYWYLKDLKAFAETLPIPSANRLRKDELEKAIKTFLTTGKIIRPTARKLSKSGVRDIDKGLKLELPIVNYTSNAETKAFIEKEARKVAPDFKKKSGARYRLNRWREAQLTQGVRITYRDLVNQYIKLNQTEEPFAKIPHGRYINFVAEFLADQQDATRSQAIRAWKELKTLDIPKDYRSWKKSHTSKSRAK